MPWSSITRLRAREKAKPVNVWSQNHTNVAAAGHPHVPQLSQSTDPPAFRAGACRIDPSTAGERSHATYLLTLGIVAHNYETLGSSHTDACI